MAEIELSVVHRQCLDRRLGSVEEVQRELDAWSATRNAHGASVRWRLTTPDARIRLRKLYPQI